MNPEPVIEARDLTKRFGDREALRGVSFSATAGELLAVIGPNGAGKTTLLSILAGIRAPDEGEGGRAPGGMGWGTQQLGLRPPLTAREILPLLARLEGVADVEATVERMLEQTGLRE